VKTSRDGLDCLEAREAVHVSLDAELTDADLKRRLVDHLARCASCREFDSEVRAVQVGLRSLPESKLPDPVLEEVWNRTTRSRRAHPWYYAAAAAAAVVVMVLGGLWLRNGTEPRELSEPELQRATREARMVLQLTSQALRRTERAAVDDVLNDGVSQALRRMPVQWTGRGAAQRGGS
jgi:predicted anti-sigma-YlaC factor YlaD